MQSDELKECPFCGGEAIAIFGNRYDDNVGAFFVGCKKRYTSESDKCFSPGIEIASGANALNAKEAIAEWNTRLPDLRTELAAALGVPVEAVTVDNLKAVVEALDGLRSLKHTKDTYGKTEGYTKLQPVVWALVDAALAPFKTGG